MKDFKGEKANRYGSQSLLLWISMGLCCVLDLGITLWLVCTRISSEYWLMPLLATIVDSVFFFVALASNFRMRYGLAVFLPYILAYTAITVMTFVQLKCDDIVAMQCLSLIVWTAVHAFAIAMSIATYVCAIRERNGKFSIVMFYMLIGLLLLSIVGYGVFGADNGFFGQGNEGTVRPIAYVYDSETDAYKADSVLQGKGNTVVITDEFNGKPVDTVGGELFCAENVKKVFFVGEFADGFDFDAVSLSADSDVEIFAQKQNIDTVRRCIYKGGFSSASKVQTRAFSLANRIVPDDLEDDEVYVTFAYDPLGYDMFEGDVLDTWIGNKGDILEVDEYAARYDFFDKNDVTSDEDLDWSYKNNGYIFMGIRDGNGNSIEGAPISDNYAVKFSFSKVYRLFVQDDNETNAKYDMNNDKAFKRYSTVNGKQSDFVYMVSSEANGWLSTLRRSGFDIEWKYSESKLGTNRVVNDLADVLDNYGSRDLYLYPLWKMQRPTLSINTDKSNNSVMYGEKISVTATANGADDSFRLRYEWSWDGTDPKGNEVWKDQDVNSFTFENVYFHQGGTYTCTVTSSAADSDLTASTTLDIKLSVTPRGVTVDWKNNSDVNGTGNSWTYNGKNQTLNLSFADGDVINSDSIGWQIVNDYDGQLTDNGNSVVLHNAGNYAISLELNGQDSEKYFIATGDSHTVNVAKATLSAEWNDNDGTVQGLQSVAYTYDSQRHAPTATVTGLGDDNRSLTISHRYTGRMRNGANYSDSTQPTEAGTYTVSVALTDASNLQNYTLSGSVRSFTVNPIELKATWETKNYIYTGEQQQPTVSKVENSSNNGYTQDLSAIAESGIEYELRSDSRSDIIGVYAGDYTATAKLTNSYSNNYDLTGGVTQDYTIAKRKITLTWDGNTQFTYNGKEQQPYVQSVQNADIDGSGVELPTVDDFSYTGVGKNANKAEEHYTVTAALKGDFARNFEIQASSDEYEYTIQQAQATVVWETDSFVYDGQSHKPVVHCEGVTSDGPLEVNVTADVNKNASTYNATLELVKEIDKQNYILKDASHEYTITKRSITLSWDQTLLTYNGDKQHPTVSSVSGAVENERSALLSNGFTYSTSGSDNESVKAGSYQVVASLKNFDSYLFAQNYEIAELSFDYQIEQKEIAVTWSNVQTVTYDGANHRAEPTALGVKGANLNLTVKLVKQGDSAFSGNYGVDAGRYTVTVELTNPDDKNNYTLQSSSQSQSFEIAQASLQLTWDSTRQFVYNEEQQYPKATGIGGEVVESERADLLQNGLEYEITGQDPNSIQEGSYTVTAKLKDHNGKRYSSNYRIVGTNSVAYTIVAVQSSSVIALPVYPIKEINNVL